MRNTLRNISIILLLTFAIGSTGINAKDSDRQVATGEIVLPPLVNGTVVFDSESLVLNSSVVVTSGGNLVIMNSDVNFNGTASNIKVEMGGNLTIVDSIVYNGTSRGVRGSDYGIVQIRGTEFSGFGNDVIRLDGLNESYGYKLMIEQSKIVNSSGDGIQVSYSEVKAVGLEISDLAGDGVKAELSTYLTMNDTKISSIGDEGIQADDNVSVVLDNVLITNTSSHALRVRRSVLPVYIASTGLKASNGAGLKLVDVANTVTIFNSTFEDNEELGVDSNAVDEIRMDSAIVSNNVLGTMVIEDTYNVDIENSDFDDIMSFVAVNGTEIHYSNIIPPQGVLAINITNLGEGNEINADYNYWGTTDIDYILNTMLLGDISLDYILDESGKVLDVALLLATSPTSTGTTSTTTTPVSTSVDNANFGVAIVPITLIFVVILRKRR